MPATYKEIALSMACAWSNKRVYRDNAEMDSDNESLGLSNKRVD